MSENPSKLFLLDAMALIYRAHFALSKNPRINSSGINTGAVMGFTNTLLEIINKEKPSHIGVAFDTHAPTFRHIAYTEYKANREKQPEEISIAIPYCKKIVAGFGIPVIELDGYEADDLIGTLTQMAGSEYQIFMMTPDKDYAQLVNEHTFLYKPAFMGNGVDILGIKEVLEKFDINEVRQVIDVLGLKGDAVDNIPGVPGIGDKTASKLLKEYGSVEEIVANQHLLTGSVKKKIEEFGEQGLFSKELATIKLDCPITFDEEALRYSGPIEDLIVPVLEELELRTIAKRIFGVPAAQKKASSQLGLFENTPPNVATTTLAKKNIETTPHNYQCLTSPKERKQLIETLGTLSEFCFDTETTSLNTLDAELVGLAISYEKGTAFYVPFPEDRTTTQALINEFKSIFENENIIKIGQNLKYDIQILRNYNVTVKGKIFDTMLAHYLIDPEQAHGMDALAEAYLNYVPVSITKLIGPKGKNQKSMRNAPLEEITEYAGEDADITFQLKEKLAVEVTERNLGKLLHEVEEPLSFVLADMEYSGVSIDEKALSELSDELQTESLRVQTEIFEIAGETFNISSPKQLGSILFEKLKLIEKPKKTKTGQYATGEDILSKLAPAHEIANKILEFREYQKLKSTYVDALPRMVNPKDQRVHTDYRQTVAVTGRLSSNNPNLQNIPIRTKKGREIRKAFITLNSDFVLLAADYSQIELRIMASFSKDKSMMEAFRLGKDIHATTASKVFGVPLEQVDTDMRRKAKEVNFGIIYGMSAFGLSQNLNISRSEAAEIIEAYWKEFPSVRIYMDACIEKAKEQGYVETILGRRRYLRNINAGNFTMRGYEERNAINAPIQGSAADLIKVAMINIHNWMKKEKLASRMLMQVHDELVFEVHHSEITRVQEKVKELMVNAIKLEVPMEVGIGMGNNWLEAH